MPVLIAALTSAAAEQGHSLMSAPSLRIAISRWENDRVRPDEFHSRLLSRVLAIPYGGDPISQGTAYQRDVVDAIDLLDDLAALDDTAMGDLRAAPLTGIAASQVVTGYLFGDSPDRVRPEPVFGVGAAQRIRDVVAEITAQDFEHGGGHVRPGLLEFFRTDVVPVLHAVHSGQARREVFAAAAETVQLLGWSSYDAGRHAVASRYFVQALRFAQEAGDRLLGAQMLGNLSHQANFLGRFDDALMYARAARTSTYHGGSAVVETMCVMMEARALASLSDRRATVAAIVRAEQLIQVRRSNEPAWIAYYDGSELAGDSAHCFRDLGMPIEAAQALEAAVVDSTPARTAAFLGMVASDVAVLAGDLDTASTLATTALARSTGLLSARFDRYVSDFRQRVPHHIAGHRRFDAFHEGLRRHRMPTS
ncbi:hypothetical protein [Nocardia asteroides]|uniref:hypothetical protein n=1 Tax=Nocardia asteroides TaxID=1824 RepID=UPI001E5AFDEB|nr:hypothetical protein [Nocardia asteroides]UGT64315.1 hypothetical protein LTT61_13940 [Nocardia asteroides]